MIVYVIVKRQRIDGARLDNNKTNVKLISMNRIINGDKDCPNNEQQKNSDLSKTQQCM